MGTIAILQEIFLFIVVKSICRVSIDNKFCPAVPEIYASADFDKI